MNRYLLHQPRPQPAFKVGDRVCTYYLFPSSPDRSTQICRHYGVVEDFFYMDGVKNYSVRWIMNNVINDFWTDRTLEHE